MTFLPARLPPLPPGLLDPKDEADRMRWQGQLTGYAARSGLQSVRVARRIDDAKEKGAKTYFRISSGSPQRPHLRTVLPTHIVFDLGDLQPGDEKTGDWTRCRREANAIAAACTALSIPFTMALTGGKGVHIEVWLEPTVTGSVLDVHGTCAGCFHNESEHLAITWKNGVTTREHCTRGRGFSQPLLRALSSKRYDWAGYDVQRRDWIGLDATLGECRCSEFERYAWKDERGSNLAETEDLRHHIARRIVVEAKRILWPEDGDERVMGRIFFDKLFIAPREGSELLTEFGERKGPMAPHRKVLWHEGHGPAPELPADREEAYLVAEARAKLRGSPRPSSIPVASDAHRFDTRWVQELTGKPCPSGPACYEPSETGLCKECPIGC